LSEHPSAQFPLSKSEAKVKALVILAVLCLSAAISAHAQSTSSTWIDVTASPHNAKNDCAADASSAINGAISGAPAGSGVIFFPSGCYLIQSQLTDTNSAAHLTYLGEGNVEIRASTSAPPTNSIIQFGNNSSTVSLRKIVNLYFNCNGDSIDGIDLDGLADSEFDQVSVVSCHGTAHMRTVGTNQNNYSNTYFGGLILADVANENGIQLGASYASANANAWSFFGTKILGAGTPTSGAGIDFEGSGGGIYGGVVSGWATGVNIVVNNINGSTPPQLGGITVSGNYIESNTYYGIRLGAGGGLGEKAVGITVTGNYINCTNLAHTVGVELEQATGFSVTSNRIARCTTNAVRGLADSTNQGADNGFVGANFIDGGQPVLLQGSNNTVTNSISTKSANYTLTGSDAWINVTGNTTISIPHAMTAQRWDVFNSGTGNVSLVCDSGTINGGVSIPIASQIGKTVTADGTSCFAH
jgi:hypothetical protein